MDFTCDLPPKFFQAFLNGVVKNVIYNDEAVTMELLKEQIFSSSQMGEQEIQGLFSNTGKLMKMASYEFWSASKLEDTLTSQCTIDDANKEIFVNFWKKEESKIHDTLAKMTVFNNQLQKFSWRVDIAAKSRHIAELNEPCALVELTLADRKNQQNVVRFEMDRKSVNHVSQQLAIIQKAISEAATR